MRRLPEIPPSIEAVPRAFTLAELAELSSERAASAAVARGLVVRLVPGFYVPAAQQYSFTARASAATRSTGGALTAEGALYAHGALDRPPRHVVTRVRPGLKRVQPDWLTLTRAMPIPTLTARGGVDVADPVAATLHLWATSGPEGAVGPTLAALQRRVVTPSELAAAAAAAGRAMRHSRAFADTLVAFGQGAESYLEHRGLRHVFTGPAFAQFIRQHYVVARGNAYWLDMYDPATRTDVELDGGEHHGAGERREYDIRRDADLATLGIATIRLSYRTVMDQPEWCRATVRAVLRARTVA
ncbi:DUF559 domain-containing protein [Demequina lignilytica]|uniref:DUF559 domain-containing protein n=1 Tax=Demequina lignilytica TaxID=3051663 RepID=A0AB35MFM6_9MICO|nr:DUF559 domain-containing protein [Demequina sp. SYSU T0a273]MDN4482578.1 DUF559 domain-containing protein [Demequina sp. SYSU T0a273]